MVMGLRVGDGVVSRKGMRKKAGVDCLAAGVVMIGKGSRVRGAARWVWCAGGAEQVSKVGSPFALDTANLISSLGGVEGVGE